MTVSAKNGVTKKPHPIYTTNNLAHHHHSSFLSHTTPYTTPLLLTPQPTLPTPINLPSKQYDKDYQAQWISCQTIHTCIGRCLQPLCLWLLVFCRLFLLLLFFHSHLFLLLFFPFFIIILVINCLFLLLLLLLIAYYYFCYKLFIIIIVICGGYWLVDINE